VPIVYTYTITPQTTLVSEGDTITYTVTTDAPSLATENAFWVAGTASTASPNDFVPITPALFGSLSSPLQTISFSLQTTIDNISEGTEALVVQVRTGGITGPVRVTADTVFILNVAPTPSPLSSILLIPTVTRYTGNSQAVIPVIAEQGAPPYTYAVTPALPLGLSFDQGSGAVSGVPTIQPQTVETATSVAMPKTATNAYFTRTGGPETDPTSNVRQYIVVANGQIVYSSDESENSFRPPTLYSAGTYQGSQYGIAQDGSLTGPYSLNGVLSENFSLGDRYPFGGCAGAGWTGLKLFIDNQDGVKLSVTGASADYKRTGPANASGILLSKTTIFTAGTHTSGWWSAYAYGRDNMSFRVTTVWNGTILTWTVEGNCKAGGTSAPTVVIKTGTTVVVPAGSDGFGDYLNTFDLVDNLYPVGFTGTYTVNIRDSASQTSSKNFTLGIARSPTISGFIAASSYTATGPEPSTGWYNVSNPTWNSFLNTYGIWTGPATQLGTVSASTTIYIPKSGVYVISIAADDGGFISGLGDVNIPSVGYTATATKSVALTAGIKNIVFSDTNNKDVASIGITVADPSGQIIWDTRSWAANTYRYSALVVGTSGEDTINVGLRPDNLQGTYTYSITASAGATFNTAKGDPTSGTFNFPQGATTAKLVLNNPHNDTTVSVTITSDGYPPYTNSIVIPARAAPGTQSFTTPGTYSFTVPVGVTTLGYTVLGAGGGQGGADQDNSPKGSLGLPGTQLAGSLDVTPGEVMSIYVGAGGRGGATGSGAAGAAGGAGLHPGGNGADLPGGCAARPSPRALLGR
jgi:hypothetical protein